MDTTTINTVLSPIIQYGFAGMCVILMAFSFWMVKSLITMSSQSNQVIAANTAALQTLIESNKSYTQALEDLRLDLAKKPCIARD